MASILRMRKVCRFASSLRWSSTITTINDDLCIAHEKRDIEGAKRIVSEAAADNKTYAMNASIYWACRFQTKDVVSKLMENRGTDLYFKNVEEDGQSFLHVACWNGDVEIIRYLLSRQKAEFEITKMFDNYHNTPLHTAVSNGKLMAVGLLLDNGAPLDKANTRGRCPHQSAARYGHTQILEKLLKNGSDRKAIDYNGHTLVHLAASSGRKEVLRYLWSEKVDIHISNTKTGQMPIHKAAAIHPFGYRTGALEFLISKGAQLDAKDKSGNRPIDLAKNMDHYIILRDNMRERGLDEEQKEILLPSVFISYRQLDEQKEFTQKFVQQLEERNITVWIDDDDMAAGDDLAQKISDGIIKSDIFVCVLSAEFFESDYCPNELDFAHNAKKRLFPIMWNDSSLPDRFKLRYDGVRRHDYNSQVDNPDEELKKCVDEFMRMVDKMQSDDEK